MKNQTSSNNNYPFQPSRTGDKCQHGHARETCEVACMACGHACYEHAGSCEADCGCSAFVPSPTADEDALVEMAEEYYE